MKHGVSGSIHQGSLLHCTWRDRGRGSSTKTPASSCPFCPVSAWGLSTKEGGERKLELFSVTAGGGSMVGNAQHSVSLREETTSVSLQKFGFSHVQGRGPWLTDLSSCKRCTPEKPRAGPVHCSSSRLRRSAVQAGPPLNHGPCQLAARTMLPSPVLPRLITRTSRD